MDYAQYAQESTIRTDLPVTFIALTGGAYPARLQHIWFGGLDGKPACLIQFIMDRDTAVQLWESEGFNLIHRLHDVKQLPVFDPEPPIHIKAELRASLAVQAATHGWDAETIMDGLLGSSTIKQGGPGFLQQAECWLLTEMIQEVPLPPHIEEDGTLKSGMRTFWHRKTN